MGKVGLSLELLSGFRSGLVWWEIGDGVRGEMGTSPWEAVKHIPFYHLLVLSNPRHQCLGA